MSQQILRVILLVPVFLFSLCFHEYAHAWVAVKRGDPTPERLGRLSMHPMAHADLLGTILLPIFCISYRMPFFGWAKPVPVDMRNFKYGRLDMALVAAAGPAANVFLALVSTLALALLIRVPSQTTWLVTVQTFAIVSIQVNLMLAFFNLLPIPPLDGFNVLQGFLTASLAHRLATLTRYANLVFFILIFTGGFRIISAPVTNCFNWLLQLAGVMV